MLQLHNMALGNLWCVAALTAAVLVTVSSATNEVCWSGEISKALKMAHTSGVGVTLCSGNYSLPDSDVTMFESVSDIAIRGEGGVVIECNSSNAGLTFIDAHNVVISDVTFVGCSKERYSTSTSFNPLERAQKYHTALYFLTCSNVSLLNVTVRESAGIAVQFFAVSGTNIIKNCSFIGNGYKNGTSTVHKAGGLYIEFPYCYPNKTLCTPEKKSNMASITDSSYFINNNIFTKNFASTENSMFVFIQKPHGIYHEAFGRGGGLSIFLKNNPSNNVFTISDNSFDSNQAYYGGGMFVELQDDTNNNSIVIANNTFSNNTAEVGEVGGGGGLRVTILTHNTNKINLTNTTFSNNKARHGGGLSFLVTKETEITDLMHIDSCMWTSNMAQRGAGADLALRNPKDLKMGGAVVVNMIRCSFMSNSVKNMSNSSVALGSGALYTNSIPVTFIDSIKFESNYDGSALVAVDASVSFANNTVAIFCNNIGRDGGAIQLLSSFIHVFYNSSFNFTNNKAFNEGGAIYAQYSGNGDLSLTSLNCFIAYFDENIRPDNWTTNFIFEGNTADETSLNSSSIFATTLTPCLWGRDYGSTQTDKLDASDVFCWNSNSNIWNYVDSNCNNEIKTDPAQLIFNHSLCIVPGKITELNLIARDDRGKDATSSLVLNIRSLSPDIMRIDDDYKYISSNKIKVKWLSSTAKHGRISIQTMAPRVLQMTINVTMQDCPPGLILDNTMHMCVCSNISQGNSNNYVLCNPKRFEAGILRGYWIGYDGASHDTAVVGECKFCHYGGSGSHITLNETYDELQKYICGRNFRSGALCSQCEEGYTPAVDSIDFPCIKSSECSDIVASAYIIGVKIAAPILMFLGIYWTGISVTSGLLHGAIFFGQMVTTAISLDAEDTIPDHDVLGRNAEIGLEGAYTVLYNVWNLELCPICFTHVGVCFRSWLTKTLPILMLKYVVAFIPVSLVIFVGLRYVHQEYCIGRCCNLNICCCVDRLVRRYPKLNNLLTVNKGHLKNILVAFIVLTYSKVAILSTYILKSTRMYDINETVHSGSQSQKLRAYFNGSMEYFQGDHLGYAIPVLVISSFFLLIIPIWLIIFRYDNPHIKGGFFNHILKLFQEDFKDGETSQQNKQNLILDIQERQFCGIGSDKPNYSLKVSHRDPLSLNYSINCCHGNFSCLCMCSTNDFRWVAGGYLLFRLAFLMVYTIGSTNYMRFYFSQLTLAILGGAFFLVVQPYKKRLHNILNGSILLLLAMVISISMLQYYRVVVRNEPSLPAYIIQYVLVFIPAIWTITCLLYQAKAHKKMQWVWNKIRYYYGKVRYRNEAVELYEIIGDVELRQVKDNTPLVFA